MGISCGCADKRMGNIYGNCHARERVEYDASGGWCEIPGLSLPGLPAKTAARTAVEIAVRIAAKEESP